jgi:hypothetical protein
VARNFQVFDPVVFQYSAEHSCASCSKTQPSRDSSGTGTCPPPAPREVSASERREGRSGTR